MKIWSFVFVFCSLSIVAQDTKEYIVTRDSAKYLQGSVLYELNNPNKINFRKFKNDRYTEFGADEILEFKTEDGSVYSSILIDLEYQFLRQIASEEKFILLESPNDVDKIFYLKHDTSIERLSRESYKIKIKPLLSDKLYREEIAEQTRYNRKSLTRVFHYGNSENRFYPRTKYGVYTALTRKKMELEGIEFRAGQMGSSISLPRIISLETRYLIGFGIFLDLPISTFTNFSARIEAQFTKSKHALSERVGTSINNYSVKLQSLHMPVLLRYRLDPAGKKNRFFVNAGPSYTKNNVTDIGFSSSNGRNFDFKVAEKMLGGIIGLGIEQSKTFKKEIGMELRYQIQGSIDARKSNSERIKTKTSLLQIIATLSF